MQSLRGSAGVAQHSRPAGPGGSINAEKLNDTTWMLVCAGGNEAFGKEGAWIVAQDNVRRRMSSNQVMSFIGARQPSSAKSGHALATDKTKIIPGHGPLASKADAQAMRTMLATVIQRIKDLRQAGKSDDEIRAAQPSAEFDARWGNGFVKPEGFLRMMLGVVGR